MEKDARSAIGMLEAERRDTLAWPPRVLVAGRALP